MNGGLMGSHSIGGATAGPTLHLWRHPRPRGAHGRCIGQTDLPVDRRKAKRLAHRIRQQARRHGWPREVHSSPLQRCALVGRILRRWGWRHHVHADWSEMNFGQWEGRRWADIPGEAVEAWVQDFAHHAPGQGESLVDLAGRVARGAQRGRALGDGGHMLVVAHAGVMQWLQWRHVHPAGWPEAAQWPAAPRYLACWHLACPGLPPPPNQ